MITIHKYPVVELDGLIMMPAGASLLTVQLQKGQAHVWAIVDTDEDVPRETRHLVMVPTGQDLRYPPDKLSYIGTFQYIGGDLVMHLFEVHDQEVATV